jgi:hypothetical protein
MYSIGCTLVQRTLVIIRFVVWPVCTLLDFRCYSLFYWYGYYVFFFDFGGGFELLEGEGAEEEGPAASLKWLQNRQRNSVRKALVGKGRREGGIGGIRVAPSVA